MTEFEIKQLQDYLNHKFKTDKFVAKPRKSIDDSCEIFIDDEFIARSIESNRVQTAEHDGQIIMTFECNGFGIYHVYARNKETGELLGATAANIGHGFWYRNTLGIRRNIKLEAGQKHCGLSIDGENTYMYNAFTDEPYHGWNSN